MQSQKSLKTAVQTLFAGLAVTSMSSPQALASEARASFELRAHADAFCALNWPQHVIEGRNDGSAIVGAVTEGCNTHTFTITAQFSNVESATLVVDGQRYDVRDGFATIAIGAPELKRSVWRLQNVQYKSDAQETLMHLSISPF